MDLKDIYQLWDRFDASNLSEMEIDMQGAHLHLVDGSPRRQVLQDAAPTIQKTEIVRETKSVEENKEEKVDGDLLSIKAPLVGTFYQSPSPDADPFVKVGQEIHKGDVIGIIEAMKLMNEVVSDVEGIVTEILVRDASMVEFDQVLMTLK